MNNIDLTKISDDLFSLIIQLNSKLFSSSKMVKCSPLPPSHVKVIFHLMNNGSSSISDIASSLCISKPNMTPIIDKLIKEDLVCRQEDCNDRRIIRIQLTQKAYEIAKNKEGFYAVFNFEAKPELIAELERNYRIDDSVMKFITVKKED